MKSVYIDNFRGFTNTTIPIENVNFLVGENSSGKTSLLSILNLVSSHEFFLFHAGFNTPEYELGNFDDIVSNESNDRSYFTIGYAYGQNKNNGKNKGKQNGFIHVVTYMNNNGTPYPKKFSYLSGKNIVHAKITNKTISYFVDKNKEETLTHELFNNVVKNHQTNEEKYKRATLPYETEFITSNTPLFLIKEILDRNISQDTEFSELTLNFSVHEDKLLWIAPIRDKPKRTYDNLKAGYTPEGTHTPYILNEILNGKKSSNKEKENLKKALRKFGKDSGLFKEVQPKSFGKDLSSPFEIDIVLENKPLKLTNVGYGVSQVLPIVVDAFIKNKKLTFAIQQPEVHLHPKAQAALGEFFYTLAHDEQKKFLIETHSDFLIDRYRIHMKKSKNNDIKSQVLFFERTENGNKCHIIKIMENGLYCDNQPSSFRKFFIDEQIKLIEL